MVESNCVEEGRRSLVANALFARLNNEFPAWQLGTRRLLGRETLTSHRSPRNL